jgi:hypothetical protein
VVVLLLVVTLAFTVAIAALLHDATALRRRIEQLEQRLAALERERAATPVIAADSAAPRTPSQLPN